MSSLKHILETFKHLNTNFKTFPFVFPRRAGIYGWSILQVYMYFMCFYIRCYSNPQSFSFLFLVLKPLILISRIMWQKVQREIKTQNRIRFGSSTQYNTACEQVLGALWRRGGKRRESLQLRLRNLSICIEKDDTKCRLAAMTSVMTSLPLALVFQCLFTFTLVSATR